MASLDLGLDYKDAQKKIAATTTYKDLKSQYDEGLQLLYDNVWSIRFS